MKISKKVFLIFLSVVALIFVLVGSLYVHQFYNKRMHSILRSLLEFNNTVYELRKLQSNITIEAEAEDTYELQLKVAKMRKVADELKLYISEGMNRELNINKFDKDIDNYYNAINEYAREYRKRALILKDLSFYRELMHDHFQDVTVVNSELFFNLSTMLFNFKETNDPKNLKMIKITLSKISSEGKTPELTEVIDRFKILLETLYLNELNLSERKNFLDYSSENFIRITTNIGELLKKREAYISRVLAVFAFSIGVLSILITFFYWVFINKYLKKFLKNQAEVMAAIKSRKPIENVPSFSPDELGELTDNMLIMANELLVKDEKLRKSEEKYRTYINTTPLAIFVVDSERRFIDVNPGAIEMLGYSKEEMLGMRIDDVWLKTYIEDNIKLFRHLEIISKKLFIQNLKTRDNKSIHVKVSAARLEEDKYLCVCFDITESMRLENELREINENLLEKVKSEVDKNMKQDQVIQQQKKLADMGMMVNAIAHQWRQPLNALALCVQDVKDEFEMGELSIEYLKAYEKNSMDLIVHMSKTIDDFRQFFTPDKHVTDFSLAKEVADLVRLLSVQVFSRNIDLEMSCTCEEGRKICDAFETGVCKGVASLVRGYPGEFKQVIVNLIYNSVDAIVEMLERKEIDRGHISVRIQCNEDKVEVRVSDNGAGIAENVRQHIFEPYFTTKPEGKGTGIGLYMSKAIIENHMNGKIYSTNPDTGACFVVELPCVIK